jgi:hypothetical protein
MEYIGIDKSKLTYIGSERYIIRRVMKEENLHDVNEWKQYLGVEKAFRKDDLIYFCDLIPDAIIVTDDDVEKPILDK